MGATTERLLRVEIRSCQDLVGESPCSARAPGWTHLHERGGQLQRCDMTWRYCEEHGGSERARAEAAAALPRCWLELAPPDLDRWRVVAAGTMGLMSEHAYVILRPNEGRWKCALGLWGHTREMPGSYARQEDAERAGVAWWRREVTDRVALIRQARGGTLDWGMPVEPAQAPRVLIAAASGAQPPPDAARAPTPEAMVAGPLVIGTNSRQRAALEALHHGDELYRREHQALGVLYRSAVRVARLEDEPEVLPLCAAIEAGDADAARRLESILLDHGVEFDV